MGGLGRAGGGSVGSRSPGGLERQRQVKVEAALAAAGRGRGRRGAPRPGWRLRGGGRPGLDPREPTVCGSGPSRRRGWAAAHKGGGSARQGVFGTCARWCPGSRALCARRARLSVPTRKGSLGTGRAGPGCWARSIPLLLSVLPAGARPFRVVGRGRLGGDCGTAFLAFLHSWDPHRGWMERSEGTGLLKFF